MENYIRNFLNNKMEKTIQVLKDELHSIRAGRANPSLLDHITVDYYGADTPLKQLANISVPEPRMLMIQPYDPTTIQAIEKSIMVSDLGINPSNDGKSIRLGLPILTEDRRKELAKLVKKVGENSKIALRNERRDANDKLKKQEKVNEITEDTPRSPEDAVQIMTDKYVKIIDDLVKQKEEEIME
ncbi:MAG: ribosome recycling factor, partial [Clostridiales bacterium]|nr:ribosome recycling factor [Clostridiales bacterium]